MQNLDTIIEDIRQAMEEEDAAREKALRESRSLTRISANAIRAIHRKEWEQAREQLAEARQSARNLKELTAEHSNLYYSGYAQDALKEYVEAHLTMAMIKGEDELPTLESLGVEPSTYINGLAEAATELRRYILDIIRSGHDADAERMLKAMDDIYSRLITIDFTDAITGGLRRRTDTVRAVLERTRGDMTTSVRQQKLQEAIRALSQKLDLAETDD